MLGRSGSAKLRDILVFLDVSDASEGRLQLAMGIARDHRACLSAVFVDNERSASSQALPCPSWRGAAAKTVNSSVIDISRRTRPGETAKERFHGWLRSYDGAGNWYLLHRPDAAELIALARAADLVIIGQSNPDTRRALAWQPEEIVIACGRPVLMVPCFGSFDEVGRRVLVAWDGSREAARALNDALPVIGAAETVTVMTVRRRDRDLGRDREAMERIVHHLARHGVAARAAETFHGGSPISDVLLSRAVDFAVDMMVAGVPHHSPVRGALVGGVSRNLFRQMTVPVLMAH